MSERRSIKVVLGAEFGDLKKQLDDAAKRSDNLANRIEASSKKVESAREVQRAATEKVATAEKNLESVVGKADSTAKQRKTALAEVTKAKDAERTATTTLAAAEADHVKITNQATTATGRLTQSLQENSDSWSKVGMAVGIVGAGLTAVAGLAVKKFADFDSAMSGVQAATMESASGMKVLRDAAVVAGADTQYSASEAADAITALAKAGVSTSDILDGGLSGALNLAAAGQLDVADAAEIAATSMNQFGLKGQDVGHISDLLAASAGKAMGDVTDMAGAFKFVGPVANQMGISIEQTAGTIAYLAQQGVLGEQAGTSLRGMLSSLTSPSNLAKKEMEALGISMYDASDNFIGLDGVAEQLKTKMGDLSNAERDEALGRIFGNEQITTARLLYQGGAAAVDEWTDAVNDSGYASEQAAILTDNLKGDLERLGGSFDTVLIQSGSGANDVLREMVQRVEDVVDMIGKIPGPVLSISTTLLGGTGVLALGAVGFMKLTTSVGETYRAFKILQKTSPGVASALGKVGKTAGIVGAALVALSVLKSVSDIIGDKADIADVDRMTAALTGFTGGVKNTTKGTYELSTTLDNMFQSTSSSGWFRGITNSSYSVQGMSDAFRAMQHDTKGVTGFFEKVGNWAGGSENPADILNESFSNFDQTMANLVASGNIDTAKESVEEFIAAGQAQGLTLDELNSKYLKQYNNALTDADNQEQAAKKSAQDLATSMGYTGEMTEEAADALQKWRDTAAEADASFVGITDAYQGVIDKNTAVAQSTADATKSSEDSWEDYYDGVSVNAKDFIKQLQDQVDAQNNWEDNMVSISDRVNDSFTGSMKDAGNEMIDELLALGPEGAAAVETINKMSDKQFAKTVKLYGEKGAAATEEFTSKVEASRQPVITPEVDLNSAMQAVQRFLKNPDNAVSHTNYGGSTSTGTGKAKKHATGGPITGPGTATSDSVLLWGSNGEFMVNAASYKKYGPLVEAINNDTLPGYAGGGYIGTPSATDSASIHAARLKAALRAANAEEKAAQKAYDAIDSSKANHAKKVAAKKDLADAKADAKSAKTAYDAAKSAVSTLRGYASDLASDKRLGSGIYAKADNPGDAISNALSNASSLLDWADSGAFSPAATAKMRKTAKSAQVRLTKAEAKLSAATDTLSDITSAYDSLRGSLTSGFSLSGMLGSTDAMGHPLATNAHDIASSAQAYAGKLSSLATKVAALRKKGAHQALIEQITALDVDEALAVADQFLADPSSISATNSALDQIDSNANTVGLAVVSGMTGASAMALYTKSGGEIASGLVDGLAKNVDAIGSSIAVAITNAMAGKGSTAKKTTKKTAKKKAVGGPVAAGEPYLVGEEGIELFVPSVSGTILTAPQTSAAMSGTTVSAGGGISDSDIIRIAEMAVKIAESRPLNIDLYAGTKAMSEVAVNGGMEAKRSGNRAWLAATGQKG